MPTQWYRRCQRMRTASCFAFSSRGKEEPIRSWAARRNVSNPESLPCIRLFSRVIARGRRGVGEASRERGNAREASAVMSGHDHERWVFGCDRSHAEDVLASFIGILASQPSYQPGTQLALADAFALPREIADERIPALIRQHDKHDDRARRVAGRRNHHDRTVAVDIVARREAEVRASLEAVFPVTIVWNSARDDGEPTAFVDEAVLGSRDQDRSLWEIGQPARVVPMRMRDQDGAQAF